VVKGKTMDGKSEEEGKKGERNKFGTKKQCYQNVSVSDEPEKGRTFPHGKLPPFWDMSSLVNEIDNPTLNFTR
jgi:hypothetical protein